MSVTYISYREKNHANPDAEWVCHKDVTEWWLLTGYLEDDNKNLYTYEIMPLHPKVPFVKPFVLMLSVTDVKQQKHLYTQKFTLREDPIEINETTVSYGSLVQLERTTEGFHVKLATDNFSATLYLAAKKEPVWHGDDGVVSMGREAPGNTSVYFSYINLFTNGELVLGGVQIPVTGKSWLERQWGTFDLADPHTHWERFAVQFFDDEELLLLAFPSEKYQEGTSVDRLGQKTRMREYILGTAAYAQVDDMTFSNGWNLRTVGLSEKKLCHKTTRAAVV